MVASLVALLLMTSPGAAGDVEVQRAIGPFEVSADATGESFRPIVLGAAAGDTAWRRARATFHLDAAPESGHWLLCLGGPGLDLDTELNGHALTRIVDAWQDRPELRAGPRFDVDAADLAVGDNRLSVTFKGERAGRGFEAGPALLLSPTPSSLLRASSIARDLTVRTGNLSSLATIGKSGTLLDRVSFVEPDGTFRLAGSVEFTFVEPSGKETPVRRLETRTPAPLFPVVSVQLEDARFAEYTTRMTAFAPFLVTDAVASRARAVVFTIVQTGKDDFSYRWRVRLFPALGGALRVVRNPDDHTVLLHDGRVGIVAPDADVVGGDDAPVALDLHVEYRKKPGELRPMAACTVVGAFVGIDPSQAGASAPAALAEVARSVLKTAKSATTSMSAFAALIPSEPSEATVAAGLASRISALANLLNGRTRGDASVFVPPEGPASAAAYFEDEWTLFQSPARERATIAWLLSTQAEDGAIRGDATGSAPPLVEIERDCYTVLRACRWYRWTYEGDALGAFATKLERALEHAHGKIEGTPVEALATSHPAGVPRLSLFHLRCALAAAHRDLADVLGQVGHADATVKELAARGEVLRKELAASATAAPDGRPEEEAVALVFGLVDLATASERVDRLAALPAAKDPIDWREAVLARGLLEAGRTEAGRTRSAAIEAAIRDLDLPLRPEIAAYHTALCYGVLGIRRDDLGTLEFFPRLQGREQVRTVIALPEGPFRVQLLPPDVQFHRQLIAQNDSSLDVLLVVGVPGGLGGEKPRVVGPSRWSIYEKLLPATQGWRERVR
jgi:hypothetical protein